MRIANPKRGGFTLIELLVVIAIISILALLGLGSYMFVFNRGTDATTASEIGQLVTALGSFKTQFGIYPPSRIRLVESCMIYTGTGAVPTGHYYNLTTTNGVPNHLLDFNSYSILKQMFPRIVWGTAAAPVTGIDWNNDGATTGDWYLQGDQCLVFFLGGIPNNSSPGTLGFSTSQANPAAPPTALNQQRIGPFFSFVNNRLVNSFHPNSPSFYSYLDAYGSVSNAASKPYAYFAASRGMKNQYNPYLSSTYGSDCAAIGAMPYCAPPAAANVPNYWNSDTFQIISAGADQLFGSTVSVTGAVYPYQPPASGYIGVVWDASKTPPSFNPVIPQSYVLPNGQLNTSKSPDATPGNDDRSNICPNLMGAGNAQN